LFCVAFSKATALRVAAPAAQAKNGIFFLQSFFFCAFCFKRKSVKRNRLLIPTARQA
jgi:hypothetical protein